MPIGAIKLLVGAPCRMGDLLCLSRSGRLRPVRTPKDLNSPIGIAGADLKRGEVVFCKENGIWTRIK